MEYHDFSFVNIKRKFVDTPEPSHNKILNAKDSQTELLKNMWYYDIFVIIYAQQK